jgi:hypothetical protein
MDSQANYFADLIEQQSAALGVVLVALSLLTGVWLDRRAAARRNAAGREIYASPWSVAKIGLVEIAVGLASGAAFVLGAAILYARIVGHL